jgi:predicted S18 family serine protease
MSLSFDYRRVEAKIKWLTKKVETETDEYKLENYKIDLDEKIYSKANMEAVAKDRMREINMWSKLKLEFNDGTFNDKNVNEHQLETYHQVYLNKAKTLTSGSSQPEVFNVVGQLETIERVKKSGELKYDKKEQLQYGKESK